MVIQRIMVLLSRPPHPLLSLLSQSNTTAMQ